MNFPLSPKYQMKLQKEVHEAIWNEYKTYEEVMFYIGKWHIEKQDWNNYWENFNIKIKENGKINLLPTLNEMDGEILLKIAIDLGVDTPDFIPSIPTFRNTIKSEYASASATFENAFKQIETHPDIAVGLANSALESIIKEIFKDERIKTKPKSGKTLYDLSTELLKEFQLFPNSDFPVEIKTIGSSMISINQSIEKLRSEKTTVHGKAHEDYVINDSLYTYFIINSVATVGLFLMSYYKKKYPVEVNTDQNEIANDDLPF